METYSLRIEELLNQISLETKNSRLIIAKSPYDEIVKVLNGRISSKSFEHFVLSYQAISGKSIDNLQAEDFDIELMINNLSKIIKEQKT
ncbi:MAG: hypothetical protein E7348_03775 [Clostridiales bacterium]|nr:hypothetical protein [Clostridiales bacterium]